MEARAIQMAVRQSARKMRLVIDQIRGRAVPEADAILRFSKKGAAAQIRKVLKSAVANAERSAERQNERLDVDTLRVRYAVVNEGPTLKRFTMAAMGRGTPIKKRTSHVEIRVGADAVKVPKAVNPAATPRGKAEAPTAKGKGKGTEARAVDPAATPRGKRAAKPRAKKDK